VKSQEGFANSPFKRTGVATAPPATGLLPFARASQSAVEEFGSTYGAPALSTAIDAITIDVVERFYGDPSFTRFRRSMSLTEVRCLD
jgi:hypothetical protein